MNPKIKLAEARGLMYEAQETLEALRKLDPLSKITQLEPKLAQDFLDYCEQLTWQAEEIKAEINKRPTLHASLGLRSR